MQGRGARVTFVFLQHDGPVSTPQVADEAAGAQAVAFPAATDLLHAVDAHGLGAVQPGQVEVLPHNRALPRALLALRDQEVPLEGILQCIIMMQRGENGSRPCQGFLSAVLV